MVVGWCVCVLCIRVMMVLKCVLVFMCCICIMIGDFRFRLFVMMVLFGSLGWGVDLLLSSDLLIWVLLVSSMLFVVKFLLCGICMMLFGCRCCVLMVLILLLVVLCYIVWGSWLMVVFSWCVVVCCMCSFSSWLFSRKVMNMVSELK